MTQEYKDLFSMVARNAAIVGERAVELTEEKGEKTDATLELAQYFRDLEDKINAGEELDANDYMRLWAGASIARNAIQKNIDTWSAVVHEYDISLIPKLYSIVTASDEEKISLAKKYFEDNENLTEDKN